MPELTDKELTTGLRLLLDLSLTPYSPGQASGWNQVPGWDAHVWSDKRYVSGHVLRRCTEAGFLPAPWGPLTGEDDPRGA